MDLYSRSYELRKEKQKGGILEAKNNGKYRGRKPIEVDEMKFLDLLSKVEEKEMSPKEAASILGISIDKYYRIKKKLQN